MTLQDVYNNLMAQRRDLSRQVLPSAANGELRDELANTGWVEENNTEQLTQGPFTFCQVLPAAGLAANAALDLTTYVGGPPAIGGISSGLYPDLTPTAGRPKTMVYTTGIVVEVSQDPLYPTESGFLFDVLSSLEIRHQAQQGNVTTVKVRDFSYLAGTVQTAGTDAVAVPAAGPGAARSSAMRVAKVLPAQWAIALASDKFTIGTNGRAIPALPANLNVRVVCFGTAYTNVANPQDYRQGPCNKDSGSLAYARFMARQIKGAGLIPTFRDIVGIGR